MDNEQVRRLAKLLEDGWSVVKSGENYDLTSDIFLSLSASKQLEIGQDISNWISYFEGRLALVRGEHTIAEKHFQDLWTNSQIESNLRYYAASDMGEIETRRGKINEAIEWNNRAYDLAKKKENNAQVALALFQLGTNYKRLAKYNEALEKVQESIDRFKREEDADFQIGASLRDKGNTLIYMGELDKAIEAFEESLAYFKKVSPLSIGETKHRIGWLQRLRGDLDKALELHQEAVGILEAMNATFYHAKALHSMGNVFAEQHDYESALQSFNRALEIFDQLEAGRHKALVLKDRSWPLFREIGIDKALPSLQLALDSLESIGDAGGLLDCNLIMGRIFLRDDQYDKAEEYLVKAQNISNEIKNEPLDIQMKCELGLLMVLTKRLTEVAQIITSVEDYAHRKGMSNYKAWTHMLCGMEAMSRKEIDQAMIFFQNSLREAWWWNQYFPRDITEQIVQVMRADIELAKYAVPVVNDLISFLERDAPHLVSEIKSLEEVKISLNNIRLYR
jgi:tetratricopeptide (TPR) repeat protein